MALLHSRPLIIMCAPRFLGIRGDVFANEKEQQYSSEFLDNPQEFKIKAMTQWEDLQSTFQSWDIDIVNIVPNKQSYDQTYTADPAFTLYDPQKNKLQIIRSCFSNTSRNKEIEVFVNCLENLDLDDIKIETHQIKNYFEGTGDNYYDLFRDIIFSGYTETPGPTDLQKGRSSLEAHKELESITDVDVLSLAVKHPCFHIDTCLTPLPSGHMLVYKEGMTDASYKKLIQKAFLDYDLDPSKMIIHISENDAVNNLVTNLLCIDNNIALPQFGDNEYLPVDLTLIKKLQDIGYKVKVHDMGQFIKIGGAIHCTSHIINKRIKGGLINL